MMIQVSDTQLHKIRQQISRQVAFPEEMSSAFDEGQANEFLQDVIQCQNDEDLQAFVTLLPRRRLNDLFGAMLVMSAAAGEQVVLRLLQILRLRITPSLSETGWAFYQHHYPNDRMNRVLSTIIQSMAEKSSDMPYLSAAAQVSDMPIIDDNLPERMANQLLQKPDELLGDFLVRMTILPDSPFAAALLSHYFQHCPDNSLQQNSDLFIHTCKINAENQQIMLLNYYYSDFRLQQAWEPINQAILELFGPPRSRQQQKLAGILSHSSDARIWDRVSLTTIDHFRQWFLINQLDKHIGSDQRKKLFIQKYQMKIRDITVWDDKTLAIHFDRFILADHKDDSDRVYYYDLNTFQMLSDATHFDVKLNNPAMKTISARQAILTHEKNNVVCLQLDQVNMLYARDFLNACF
jgi:hypothetical protein